MYSADRSVQIAASPEKVWACLTEFSRWGQWLEHRDGVALTMRLLDSGQIGVGQGRALKLEDDRGFSQDWTIERWEAPAALALAAKPPHASAVRVALTPLPTGATQVDLHLEIELPGGLTGMLAGLLGFGEAVAIHADTMLDGLKDAAQGA